MSSTRPPSDGDRQVVKLTAPRSLPRMSALAKWGMLVATMTLGSLACNSPAAPSDPYTGSWSGTMDDEQVGMGSLQVTLSTAGGAAVPASLSGSWTATFAGATLNGPASVVPATGSDTERYFTLGCGGPQPMGTLVMTAIRQGSTIQATYFSIACAGLSRGTARLTRR